MKDNEFEIEGNKHENDQTTKDEDITHSEVHLEDDNAHSTDTKDEFKFVSFADNETEPDDPFHIPEEELFSSETEEVQPTNNQSNAVVSLDERREQNNVDEGIKWLHRAIAAGDIYAISEMAYLYLRGVGIPKNIGEGRKWLERAAEAGDSWAMMELGFRLLVGEDFEQDRELGEKWLRRSAECNYPTAMRILGYRLLSGDELEQNIEEGEMWLRKAAEAGEPIAMREWGKYLIFGIDRITKENN